MDSCKIVPISPVVTSSNEGGSGIEGVAGPSEIYFIQLLTLKGMSGCLIILVVLEK